MKFERAGISVASVYLALRSYNGFTSITSFCTFPELFAENLELEKTEEFKFNVNTTSRKSFNNDFIFIGV